MSTPKPPPAPDPVATAQAQGTMNRETAVSQYLLGATNQKTPFGSLTYTSLGSWGDNLQGTGSPGTTTGSSGPMQAAPQTPQKNPFQPTVSYGNDSTPVANPDYAAWDKANPGGIAPVANASMGATTRSPSQFNSEAYDVPRFQVEQTLTPDLQAIVDNFLGTGKNLSNTVSNTLSQQFDTSGLPSRAANMGGGSGMQSSVDLQNVPVNASWSGPDARYTIDNAGQIQKNVGADDFSADRLRVEDALFSRLNPQFDRDQSKQEANLIARGIRPGTVAYDRARDEQNRSLTDARMQTILAGGQEQSRLSGLELAQGGFRNAAQAQQYGQNANDAQFFNNAQAQNFGQSMTMDQFARDGIGMNNGTALQGAGFRNQAQNQEFNQVLAANQFNNANRSGAIEENAFLRSLPLNEIQALLGGTQVAGPKFQNTPQPGVAGVDYTGLVNQQYQGQMQAYNAAQQNRMGMLGGIAGIGSSLIGLSDRRLKTNIKRIGTLDNGLGLYSYTYQWGGPRHIGVMADEVTEIMPDAVSEVAHGFMAVDYEKIAEAA